MEGSGSNPGQMKYVVSVARCTIDGELRFNVAAPGYFSFRSVAAADDEGVLIIYRPAELPDPADLHGIRGLRVSFDGEMTGPFEIFPWPVESLDSELSQLEIRQTSDGFVFRVSYRDSTAESYSTVFVRIGSDGKTKWIHRGYWFEDGSGIFGGWLTVNTDGTLDALRAQINYDTGLTLPRLTRIKADASGIAFDRQEIPSPTGVPGEWDVVGRWDVKEGILVLGYQTATGSPDDGIAFVALYDRDFEVRWVKSYGPTYSHPQLVRDGDDWLLSWDVHADWRSVTGVPGMNMSIARFTGVCALKDCGNPDQSMNQGQ